MESSARRVSKRPGTGPRRLVAVAVVLAAVTAADARAQCSVAELGKLIASDSESADQLGISVAVDGDTAVVGAWLEDGAGSDIGAAYVFERDLGGTEAWGEAAKLTPSDGGDSDAFGWSVAASGDLVLVGAYRADGAFPNSGKAYVFERDLGGAGAWGELRILTPSDAADGDQFGYSVAISGGIAVIGARQSDALGADSGAAYVFAQNAGGAGNWGQVTRLTASDGLAGHLFGRAVAIDGDTVFVGAPGGDGLMPGTGAAYVFDRFQGGPNAFGEVTKMIASDGRPGDEFGFSVDVTGPTGIVGAYLHDAAGQDSGGAYLYDRFQGGVNVWGQITKLVGSTTSDGDAFGYSVGVEAGVAVVGAYLEDGGGNARGVVHGFGRNYGGLDAWGQSHRVQASDAQNSDRYGFSVALDGTTLGVGATHEDAGGNNAGAGYVNTLAGGPVNYCTAGTSASGCQVTLSASGLPSASANFGFVLAASGIEGGKKGLFFFGSNGRQAVPWGAGTSFQCVVPPVFRGGSLGGSGTPGGCNGSFQQDLNALWCPSCPRPTKNPGPGAVVQAQFWYRDPANSTGQTTSLSDAIEFSVCP